MNEQHSRIGYSAISCFMQCPYQYRLRHIDGVEMLDEYDAQNALTIGTALHRGIETDAETAIREYYMSYPVITDLHINEAIKLGTMIRKVKAVIPDGRHEVFFEYGAFKGTADLLVPNDDGTYDLYDFKYSNNIDKYVESAQLHVYKHFAEKALGIKIRKMYFVFAQKTMIRQKKTEDLNQFRLRLKATLENCEVTVKEVSYDAGKVMDFLQSQVDCLTCTDYKKQQSRLCDWCEYQSYCENGRDLNMALPSINRVDVQKASKKKIWIYGAPYSGKTTFADQAPTPLNLNTDGNVKYVTMPRLTIKDEVTSEGRITKRKFAWEIFKEAIGDLEKGSDFETVVVDLLEDTYEHCRLYMYEQLGITHESDDSFRAWDKVRTEYLSTVKRLLNLDYNIILISHEDTSKDLTKRGGDKITAIMPNLNEKASKKISGMVDLVARLVVDGDKRTLNFKSDEVVFGGGRLQGVKTTEIPLSWDALCKVYDEAIGKIAPVEKVVETPVVSVETVDLVTIDLSDDVETVPIPEQNEPATPIAVDQTTGEVIGDKPVRRRRKRNEN